MGLSYLYSNFFREIADIIYNSEISLSCLFDDIMFTGERETRNGETFGAAGAARAEIVPATEEQSVHKNAQFFSRFTS